MCAMAWQLSASWLIAAAEGDPLQPALGRHLQTRSQRGVASELRKKRLVTYGSGGTLLTSKCQHLPYASGTLQHWPLTN